MSAMEEDLSNVSSEEFSENESESLSIASDDSFASATSNCEPYDESIEPVATAEEAEQYASQVAVEEEEEEQLLRRFAGEIDVGEWCKCSKCSLENIVREEECRCCKEIDRCMERMEELEKKEGQCITTHPGFENVCLSRWVLQTAGIGLKTRAKKSYTTKLKLGEAAEDEFLRSVAYRQFVRFVWEYVGKNNRIPLPSCVYNAIRTAFPNGKDNFHGYEEVNNEEEV